MALRFIEMKDIVNLKDGDPVAGVCYAAAAEDIIKMNGLEHRYHRETKELNVIGYLVEVDDDDDVLAISDFENAPDEVVVATSSRSMVAIQTLDKNEGPDPRYSSTMADRDKVREAELASQTRIKSDFDLQELGAIRRRLGRGVV